MEVELKLLVDAKFKDALLQHPLLASHALSKPHERTVADTYFDTPKRSLRHSDAGLRVIDRESQQQGRLTMLEERLGGVHEHVFEHTNAIDDLERKQSREQSKA